MKLKRERQANKILDTKASSPKRSKALFTETNKEEKQFRQQDKHTFHNLGKMD